MSAVLNDRDAILQAAATRIVNPKNADILLSQSAPAFHVTAGGTADVASITVSATLVGLEGAVSWSVQGATLSNVTDREATVTYANMQGSTAIVSASIMSSGERFAKSVVLATIQDGAPGSSAKTVKLTPSEQVFKVSKTGTNSPASITLTATGQNTAGTPSFTIPVGTATLTAGSSSAQKVLTFANMTTDQVTIEVTLDGQKDRVTIYKVREGQDGQPGADGIVGLLNNESVNLPASDSGVVSSVAGAVCTMKVYRGGADDSTNWSYVFSPASAAAGLQYTTSGGTLTVTGLAAGVDSAYVDITASRTGYASITKRFSVAKAKSGAGGAPGVDARNLTLAASSQVVQVAKNGTASPASITLTSTAQNLAGTPTFAITSGTATLTGTGSARSFTYASMTSDSVTVRVTQDGLTDTVTIVKLREGADGVSAITGMLSNEIVTLPASSAGVVSSFSGAVCSMKVYNGTADDTANWSFAYAPASSTASLQYTTTTSGTVTVTGMNNGVDSAYVDITATRTGYASITKRFFVTKSKAGASVTGARGAGQHYVVGSVWSDVAAQAACPGGPVVNDQVTISNGTVTYTKRWDGAAWNVPGAYLSDDLFVEKGIRASKIDTNGLVVRAPDGTVLLDMGGLRSGYEAPGTKNSELSSAINSAASTAVWGSISGTGKPADNATVGADATNFNATVGGDNLTPNSSFEKASGGLATGFSIYNNAGASEPTTASDGAGRVGTGRSQVITWTTTRTNTKGIRGVFCKGGWVPQKTYIVSVHARTDGISGTERLALGWNTAPATTVTVQNPVLTTSWQRYVWRITMGATVEGGGGGYLSIANGTGSNPGNVYFDDMMVVEGDVLPSYYASAWEAQETADAANEVLADIASDNKLTPSEKPETKAKYDAILAEQAGVEAQATALGITTEKTAYTNAITALKNYFAAAGMAGWDTIPGATITIVGTAFRNVFNDVYAAKQVLLNRMTAVAATVANNLKVVDGGNGSTTFGQRGRNDLPSEYPVGTTRQFKVASAIGLPDVSGANMYCTLDTTIQYSDSTGGAAYQYAYRDGLTYRRFAANRSSASWNAWVQDLDRAAYTGDLDATKGAPSGTNVGSVTADAVATATTNFNASNDRNATAVTAPTIATDGTAVDHTIRTDGSADISFEWAWAGTEGDIDGFLVYVYQSTASTAYTVGTTPASETVFTVPANKRAFILTGAAADLYTTFGVRAYRSVDKDINAAGVILSGVAQPSIAAEKPYRPSASVAFAGNVTGTIDGTAAATVKADAAAGKSASDALPGINTSLAGKLAAAGNQNLTGPVTLTSSGAIVVGTVNDGVRINTTGIIGRKGGYTTFSVAADGTALFGGNLVAASGTLGKLQILDTLFGGDFTGWGWPADKSKRGWAISPFGAIFGNYNDGQWIDIQANGNMTAPGFSLIDKQLTLDRPIIVNPRVSQPVYDTFAYNALGGGFVSGPNGNLSNSVTLQITGNNGPHKIAWSYVRLAGGTPSAPSWADGSGDTFGVSATASNTTLSFKVSAVITGADGRTLNYSDIFTLQFGTI